MLPPLPRYLLNLLDLLNILNLLHLLDHMDLLILLPQAGPDILRFMSWRASPYNTEDILEQLEGEGAMGNKVALLYFEHILKKKPRALSNYSQL